MDPPRRPGKEGDSIHEKTASSSSGSRHQRDPDGRRDACVVDHLHRHHPHALQGNQRGYGEDEESDQDGRGGQRRCGAGGGEPGWQDLPGNERHAAGSVAAESKRSADEQVGQDSISEK